VILGVFGIATFSQEQVITPNRRARVQNELSYVFEHMSKYVQQSNGNVTRKAIRYLPGLTAAGATGFRVYIDLRTPQTPSNFADDGWIDYTLTANTLTATCTANGGTCPFAVDNLTSKIIAGVVGGATMPVAPASGFYVLVDPLGNFVDVGLVGRFDPARPATAGTRFANPQIEMKTKVVCNSSSTN
jgi:hypothetical protein